MTGEAMPFYKEPVRWKKKALRIREFILLSSKMEHNGRDIKGSIYLIRNNCSMGRQLGDDAETGV